MEFGFTIAAYAVAAVLFILSLGGLSGQESAKRAVWYGIAGMAIAVLATMIGPGQGLWWLSIVLIAIGAGVGYQLATRVQMTQMPELVAIMHSLVGLAAVFVGFNADIELGRVAAAFTEAGLTFPRPEEVTAAGAAFARDFTGFAAIVAKKTGVEVNILRVELMLGIWIGAVTFTGSVIAYGKLAGKVDTAAKQLPGGHLLNAGAALASLVLGMGLPVTAAYIVLGTLSAPALNELISQAHLIDLIAAGELPNQARAIFMLAAPDQVAALSQPMSEAQAAVLLAKVPPDFSSQLYEQALSPEVLTTALLSAHMIIFWLSQDSNVTPPVCLTAFAAAAIAKTPPMATGFTAWRIAKGMYIIPLLFAYTPLLSGDWGVALEIAFFGSIGLYGLASAYEGYGEAPVPLALRPVLVAAGVGSLWPLGIHWHALAAATVIGLTVLTVVLERRRGRPRT